ncbi:MAG: hypothetical protein R3C11_12000 [Planctomycetaceae bacterium]
MCFELVLKYAFHKKLENSVMKLSYQSLFTLRLCYLICLCQFLPLASGCTDTSDNRPPLGDLKPDEITVDSNPWGFKKGLRSSETKTIIDSFDDREHLRQMIGSVDGMGSVQVYDLTRNSIRYTLLLYYEFDHSLKDIIVKKESEMKSQ